MNYFILISILFTIFSSLYNCDVSLIQRKQLIDSHNKYRRDIAQGKVTGQPSASNMIELVSRENIYQIPSSRNQSGNMSISIFIDECFNKYY